MKSTRNDLHSDAETRLSPSEITPRPVFEARREILRGLAAQAAVGSIAAWAGRDALAEKSGATPTGVRLESKPSALSVLDKPAPRESATSYNNFYEFGTSKQAPAAYAEKLRTRPWTISVEGLVAKPKVWAIEDLLKLAGMEERVYRLRCVEGWSMVIPWIGYSLSELLKRAEPASGAKFVEFVSVAQTDTMPGLRSSVLDWPYVEGLRLDEAMHPLAMLVFGMYGELLPNQNGAPLRLAVPWKYGFKSAKSIVKIRLTDKQPVSSWERVAPSEYGFYSNVNPEVDHPRWSQASERRIPDDGLFAAKRKTLMFNGYATQVASLYSGMDLRKNF
jgi:sulfoxide reductase catalytic subunit YedY